jgi:uncharacterized lipoprotein YajG
VSGIKRASKLFILSGLAAAILALAACSAQGEATTSPVAEQQLSATPELPTATVATVAAVPEDQVTGVESDKCMDCHTNKERLILTAAPEEAIESENSGEG